MIYEMVSETIETPLVSDEGSAYMSGEVFPKLFSFLDKGYNIVSITTNQFIYENDVNGLEKIHLTNLIAILKKDD